MMVPNLLSLGAFLLVVQAMTAWDPVPAAVPISDIDGNAISTLSIGQQAILEFNMHYEQDNETQPFVALMEVRGSDGVTQFLAWQMGTLSIGEGNLDVGFSWRAERAGDYQVRSFLVTSLTNPEVLSDVRSSNFSVIE